MGSPVDWKVLEEKGIAKEDVTGVVFESWHYRYVGVEAATEIMRDGITLEEYCQRHGV